MTKNPIINAAVALIYIVLVASVMYYGPKFVGPIESVLAPIAMLSLFVLSASVMGFLFFYQPVRMYLDSEKERAVAILLQTVGVFAAITVLLFISLFLVASL